MKRFSTILFFATFFCLTSVGVYAQSVIYLDADYNSATAANYTYKRVFKYKEEILHLTFGRDYCGNSTSSVKQTGIHVCTVTDYYRTGEIALVGKIIAGDVGCSQRGGFDGQVVAYYKNGNIKRKETWKSGIKNGVVIFYDEEGNENKREDYVNGKLIEENRFAAPADSPIIGTWKYVECPNNDCSYTWRIVRTSTFVYSQNGVVESKHEQKYFPTQVIKGNWKYTPKTASSGILEEYQGEDLIERGTVKFLNRNQLEYMVTFSPDSNGIGKQYIWTRQ